MNIRRRVSTNKLFGFIDSIALQCIIMKDKG